jgi:hypothetical protein
MRRPNRLVVIWAVNLLLWGDLVLFMLAVHTPLHRVFFKAPRLWVVLGLMVLLPIAALVFGRRTNKLLWRRANAAGAIICLVVFTASIAVPMVWKATRSADPKNPKTPRPIEAQTGIPVFPGAEGFGTRTRAGRGGKVIAVTSLADSGPGSLRAALLDPNPRTIVFRVGGTIELRDHLYISHPFVSVAGQTAPGDGICLKDAGMVITTHDVLIQYLRIRPGNEGKIDPENNDAIAMLGKFGSTEGAHHIVIDHVSASWSEDETLSTWSGAHDVTICWSILSEALNRSRHRKHTHSAGLMIGNSSEHVSVHHCLLAHNDFRNPLIISGGTHDIVNNVIYDWGVLPAEVVDYDSNSFLNFVMNYFVAGPSTEPRRYEILINHGKRRSLPKIYLHGNIGPHRPDEEKEEWSAIGFGFSERSAPKIYQSAERFATHSITTQSAPTALEAVLQGVGALFPRRDSIDQRITSEVIARKGRIIDSPAQVGGHPQYAGGVAPLDSDNDGIPDEWERKMGLRPDDPSDAAGDADGNGYTNLEEYLHTIR